MCETVLQPCYVNALCLDAPRKRAVAKVWRMPSVRRDLVRRLSAPHHAASLRSGLSRDPFPRVGASAFRDPIQLCLYVSAGISRLSALTLISPVFISAVIPGSPARFSASYLSAKSVTACIFMKTIAKLQMPFFPSCIMDLGTLASPGDPACGDTPAVLPYTLAPDSCARDSSLPCRLPRLGSLTTE